MPLGKDFLFGRSGILFWAQKKPEVVMKLSVEFVVMTSDI
jgi:hypothetical protein